MYKNKKFRIWDLGGQESLRKSWNIYYENCKGIIFVVDSSDKKRMNIVKKELFHMLTSKELNNVKILIFLFFIKILNKNLKDFF